MPQSHRRIMMVPSWFPSNLAPGRGAYFSSWIAATQATGGQVSIVAPNLISLRDLAPRRLVSRGTTRGMPQWAKQARSPRVFAVPGRRASTHRRWERAAERAISEIVESTSSDYLFHVHSAWRAGEPVRQWADRLDSPVVVSEHLSTISRIAGTETGITRRLRAVYQHADFLTAVSSDLAAAVSLIADRDCHVLPNPINTDLFSPGGLGESGTGPLRLLAVGGLTRIKRFDLLISAVSLLRSRGNVCELRIAGDGPLLGQLKAHAAREGVGRQVKFLGHVKATDLVAQYRWAQMFVSSSEIETFGVAIAEALATGTPAVVTAGCAQVTEMRRLFPWPAAETGSSASLADVIATAAEALTSHDYSAVARLHVVQNFSVGAIADRLKVVYSQL